MIRLDRFHSMRPCVESTNDRVWKPEMKFKERIEPMWLDNSVGIQIDQYIVAIVEEELPAGAKAPENIAIYGI